MLIAVALFLCLTTGAQGQYYFGRNKIQYNNFQWQILRTRHFDIYFYPEMRELADMGAAFAEESYTYLENKFNHTITHRIPLIFYSNHSHFQQTNTVPNLIPEGVGGFFEFLKGRVVIPADGSIHQFKHVIRHELVHVFTHSKANRVLKDHKRTNHPGLPLWFVEGLAEYWSEGWDSQAEMFLRDAVLSGYLVSLSDMYTISGTFLMYKEGQAICKYIAEHFGEEKIIELFDNLWKEEKFSNVLKLTIGLDYKAFDEQWTYHLKKEKYPLLASMDFPKMVTRRITDEGINAKPAFYRADGQRHVAFISNRVGYSNIYEKLMDAPSPKSRARVLIEGERTSEFEAFHLLRSKIDVDSNGVLAFVSKSGERDVLYLYDIKHERILRRFEFDDLVTLFSPAWAPDNQHIAFSGINFAGRSDLYIVDTEDGTLQKLTNDFYDDRDPSWSSDGKAIAFSSDRTPFGKDGYYNLFLYDLAEGAIHYLTYGPHNDYAPAWSPDGRTIAFTSDRDGAFNIWMVRQTRPRATPPPLAAAQDGDDSNDGLPTSGADSALPYPCALLNGNALKQVTHFTTGAFDPAWTDDGSLLFTAFENFSFQIRELTEVDKKFDEATLAALDRIEVKRGPWSAERINGMMATTTVKYKRKFDLDIAQSQVTQDPIFGTSGGAQLAFTDMLGNHQLYFLIYNNAQTRSELLKSFNIAVSKVDLSRRTSFAYGAYHLAGRYYNLAEGFFFERRLGGFGAVSYPISTFRRIEGSINFRTSDKEWFSTGYRRKALLASNFLSYVKDNSLWGPSGPVDGERFNFSIGNTLDVAHSNVNFITLMGDYRKYFRLSPEVTFAVRLLGRFNQGRESLPFFMGGSWDLRGYRLWSLWGRKLFLASNELRFPFIDNFLIRFPFGGMGFNAIRGATFLDFGNAWDDDLREVLGSAGFGVRFRLGGFLVLRFDLGKKFTLTDASHFYDPSQIRFQPGLFKQFFFGWDF